MRKPEIVIKIIHMIQNIRVFFHLPKNWDWSKGRF